MSNSAAEAILADEGAVSELQTRGGLVLTEEMTKSQRRAAVKKAVEQLAEGAQESKKAASRGETAREYHGEILDIVRENLHEIQNMEAVSKLTGEEFRKTEEDGRPLRQKVIEFFNSIGNKVFRSDMGEIALNTAGVRDSLAHGYGRLKAATFAALPEVLEKGKVVKVNAPYERHNYESWFISAPVEVGGRKCYVGALVIRDEKTQRYKLHEVLTTNESGTPLFKSESVGKNTDGPLRSSAPLGTPDDVLTDSIMPESSKKVKGFENGKRAGEEAIGQEAARKGQLERAGRALGKQGAQTLQEMYDGESSTEAYYGEFAAYYKAGVDGKAMEEVESSYAGALNEMQRRAAYLTGQADAGAKLKAEQAGVKKARSAGAARGLLADEYVRAHLRPSERTRIDTVAKALGVQVRFVDSVLDGKANGNINIGAGGYEVLIERGNPNPVLAILGHEWTHRMQQLAPEAYRTFREAAAAELDAEGTEALQELYLRKGGIELDYQGALDEAAANYAGELLKDGKLLDKFIRKHRKEKGLVRWMLEAVRGFVDKLTGKERQMARTAKEKLMAALEAAAETARGLKEKNSSQEDADRGMMETARNSLKEELERGRARKETREAFERRGVEEGFRVIERGGIGYGYRPVSLQFAQANAGQVFKEARRLGQNAEIIDGEILWNLNGITVKRTVPEALTIRGVGVFISDKATVAPRNIAGHESFRFWKDSEARKAYEDVIEANIEYSSEAFQGYRAAIEEAYFGDTVALDDTKRARKLLEELLAYISGDIHEGTNDELMRGMFKDFDAVKAAWEELTTAEQEARDTTGERRAGRDEGARYSLKYDPETASVKEQIANSRETLADMDAIVTVQVPEHFARKADAVKWGIALLEKTGYSVDRKGYGKITFSPKDINYGMNYADTDAEMAAIAALPYVLKRGVEIGRHNDHKGRQKTTVTFAGPVVLNNIRGNMAVVVNQNGNHYYTHRIVMPDGTAFVFSAEKSDAAQEPSQGVAVSSSLAKTTSAAPETSISEDGGESNSKFSPEAGDGARYSLKETERLTADDLGDYLKTGTRRNKNKAEALARGEKIILTSDAEIAAYIRRAVAGENMATVAYGKVPERLADEIMRKSGGEIDLHGAYLELVASDLKHAYNGHLKAKEEGDIDLTEQDFERIPEYLDGYDEVLEIQRQKDGSTKVLIGSDIGKGKLLMIEVVSSSRNALQLKTMYGQTAEKYEQHHGKKRKAANTKGVAKQPFGTASDSITPRDAASGDSISQNGEDVNSKFSLKGETELLEKTRRLVMQARREGWSDAKLRDARLQAVEEVYQRLLTEYGAIDPGETPAREVQVPKRTSESERVSRTVRTILEAKATPEAQLYGAVQSVEGLQKELNEPAWRRLLPPWQGRKHRAPCCSRG